MRMQVLRRTFCSSATTSKSSSIQLHWLDLRGSGLSIVERLLLEECLLRHDERNWLMVGHHPANDPKVIRIKTPSYMQTTENPSTAIVMGIGGKPKELLHIDLVEQEGCLTLKRFSGGGTVVLDYDSIWTTIIGRTRDFPHVEAFPRPIMEWSVQTVYGPLFDKLQSLQLDNKLSNDESNSLPQKSTLVLDTKSCAIENTGRVITILSQPVTSPNDQQSEKLFDVPNFALQENDYVLGKRKMGGNAQAIVKNGWLHHTSFLWDYQMENMNYLTLPQKRPKYRQDRKHNDFLVKLNETYPDLTKTDFYSALFQVCQESFAVEKVTVREAMAVVDEKHGGLQKWFEKGSRTKILHDLS